MIAAVVLGLFSQIENWKRDLSINFASLDAKSPDSRLHPPIVPQSVQETEEKIKAWVEQAPRWSIESSDLTAEEGTIHLTRTTKIFRWVDDIQIRLHAEDDGTRIEAESRSRVGKGDLGQNPRNLREMLVGIGATEGDR